MGDDESDAIPGTFLQTYPDFLFRGGIDGGSGVIKNQNFGVEDEGSGNVEPLTLSS